MPIYEFICRDCGRQFEELVRSGEAPACPGCGKKSLERQMSAPSAHAKGGDGCAARDAGVCSAPRSCCGGGGCCAH